MFCISSPEQFQLGLTMALNDPILAYIARSNKDAIILKQYLEANGITAEFTEDYAADALSFNPKQAIHQPQIWINRRDSEAVAQLLTQYETIEHDKNEKQSIEVPEVIDVVCDECGQTNDFPGSMTGSVQACRHCAAWLDVDDPDAPIDGEYEEYETEEE